MAASLKGSKLPEFYTVKLIAEVFGAHPQTVRRWVRAGRISALKAGDRNHKLWFTWPDVRAFLDTRTGIRWFGRVLR
jgi:excisionase family DNA binding protein